MKPIFFVVIFTLLLPTHLFGQQEDDLFLHWLTFAANDVTLIEQRADFFPSPVTSDLHERAIDSKNLLFKQFVSKFGVLWPDKATKQINTTSIPKAFIQSALNRRIPIKNSLHVSGSKHPYYFSGGLNVRLGYLEYIQIVVLQQLIANKDYRFLEEVLNLKKHLFAMKGEMKEDFGEDLMKSHVNFATLTPSILGQTIAYYVAQCSSPR